MLVCCLALLAKGNRGLCKHHCPPERKLDSDLTQFCYFNIYQFLSSSESWYPYVAFFTDAAEHSSWVFGKKILVLQFRWCSAQVLCKYWHHGITEIDSDWSVSQATSQSRKQSSKLGCLLPCLHVKYTLLNPLSIFSQTNILKFQSV